MQKKNWHLRLGQLNYKLLKEISSLKIIKGLPFITTLPHHVCSLYQLSKPSKRHHNKNKLLSTTRTLKLLHMDMMSLIWTASIGGRKYILIIINNFFRYSRVLFLREKLEAFDKFKTICIKLQNKKN